MSKITELIFKGADHYVTSVYGPRKPIETKYGKTSNFHKGTDYGTHGKKVAQYAVEKGTVLSKGVSTSCGNYVWINYPRLNVKMCHYHLDSINVKNGQKVDNNTLIGYTGTTGYSTGIHLHLGVYDLINDCYVDPELYAKKYNVCDKKEENKQEESTTKFEIGDKVIVDGDLYLTANSETPNGHATNEETIITRIAENAKHPYNTTGDLGWMDEESIKLMNEENIYIVKEGDNLSSIAKKYNTTWQKIYEDNKEVIGDNPNLIIPGQKLVIK